MKKTKTKKCPRGMCLMMPASMVRGNAGPYRCVKCGKKSPGFMGIKHRS